MARRSVSIRDSLFSYAKVGTFLLSSSNASFRLNIRFLSRTLAACRWTPVMILLRLDLLCPRLQHLGEKLAVSSVRPSPGGELLQEEPLSRVWLFGQYGEMSTSSDPKAHFWVNPIRLMSLTKFINTES